MKNEVLTINVEGIGEINISATMRGESKNKMFNLRHFTYNLRIWSEHGKMTVTYHDSAYNYSKNVRKLGKEELMNALDCILSDISMYENDEIEGCYGDEDFALMQQAKRGCKRERDRFVVIVGGEENLWPAIEKLTEYINEN